MKKSLLAILLFCSIYNVAFAQAKTSKPQLSAFTLLYMNQVSETKGNNTRLPGYVYKFIGGKTYISAFIKVNETINETSLSDLGILTGTKAGKIWTVQVPVESVGAFTELPGISNIDLDAPIYPMLDAARKSTKADSAQKGIGLPVPMTGNGVVVGIIDAGFDFDHPTLYDTLHSLYRVKRAWPQKTAGTPPMGFHYGKELTDPYLIRSMGTDTAITSHGTHVAGIAAGSGYGSAANNRYRGIAYESDIVIVGIMPAPYQWATPGTSDIIDGMSYIFSYAASVYKPCIVNLSWGSSIGPHDGQSFFSQACDALTGPGRIFACSAGNNGDDTLHLEKTFTATNTSVSTFVTFSEYLDSTNKKTWLDIWGDTGKNFCLKVRLFDGPSAIDSTEEICITNSSKNYFLTGSNGDTCFITTSTVTAEYNGRPHAFMTFHSKVADNICLTVTGTSGTINMWEGYVSPPTGYYGALKKLGYPWAVSGDTRMTTSDYSSSFSAISVGAYTSKSSFTNISGAGLGYPGAVAGRIAPFSSRGPAMNNRTKPDITGPGFGLASGVSSFDTSYGPTGDNYGSVISNVTLGGRVYPYAMAAGTSMSSPAVSGVIALLLQMNSNLTPDSVKTILRLTAIRDSHTGVIPSSGSNTWGHGKVNAYAALKYMVQSLTVVNTLTEEPLQCILYPNPSSGRYTVSYISPVSDLISVDVYDITGRTVYSRKWTVEAGGNSIQIEPGDVAKGLYFTKLSAGSKTLVIKTLIN